MPLVCGCKLGDQFSWPQVQPFWMGRSDQSHADLGYLVAAQ